MEEKEYFVIYMGTIKKVLLKEVLPGRFEDKYHQIYWKENVFSSKEELIKNLTEQTQKKNFNLTAQIIKIRTNLKDIPKNLSYDFKDLPEEERDKIIDKVLTIALKQIEDCKEELHDDEDFLTIQLDEIKKL